MSLNFPNTPTDGQNWTDTNGQTWVYNLGNNSWTALGAPAGGMVYRGGIDITAAPPAGVKSGWLYTVTTAGTANAGFTGLTGTVVAGTQVVYSGTGWQVVGTPGAWTRTGTELTPVNAGDSVFTGGAVKVGGTTAAPKLQIKADGGIVANTDGLVYDAATKRLGVGTSSPSEALHVVGKIAVSGTSPSIRQTVQTATIDLCGGTTIGTDASIQLYASSNPSDANHTFYNSNVHIWRNAASTTQYGRFDSSGRLLLGTSSSSAPAIAVFQGFAGTSAGSGEIFLQRGQTNPASGFTLANINFADSAGSVGARITAEPDLQWNSGDYPTRLSFSTCPDNSATPVERLRITNLGFIKASDTGSYKSTTSGNHEFTNSLDTDSFIIRSTNASYSGNTILVQATRNTTNNSFYAISYYNTGASAYRFRVADSGNVTNTNNSYAGISDLKLKENIVDSPSQWSDLKALRVRKYNFKEETGQPTHTQIGLVAQEAELVSPGLVSESPDRDEDGNDLGTVTKSVNYSVLYMKAVKALQEAMERIETLEQRLTDAGIA